MNRKSAYAAWPLGLVLVLAYTMGGACRRPAVPPARPRGGRGGLPSAAAPGGARPAATALAVAGVGLFVLVGVVGPPTAREPLYLLLNAVACSQWR